MSSKKLSFSGMLISASFIPYKKETYGGPLSYRFSAEIHLYDGLCLKSDIYAFNIQPGVTHESLVDVVLTDDGQLTIKLQ